MGSDDKPLLGIRLQPHNRFTFPVLLNALEHGGLDQHFEVCVLEKSTDVAAFAAAGRPGLLLYSFMSPHAPALLPEVNRIRKIRNRKLRLLAGGPHPGGDPESTLRMGFDYILAGEGESAFPELVRRYLSDDLPAQPTIFHAPPLSDLEKSYPFSGYLKIRPPLEMSRGCYWNCRFCQTACVPARHRSLESFKKYYRKLQVNGFHRRVNFICPSASEYGAGVGQHLNLELLGQLFEFCKSNGTRFLEFGIFPSEARPNRITAPFLDLVNSYCSNRKLTVGAQSGSNRLLKSLRRGHTVEQVVTACELIHQKGLQPLVDIIVGFPGESPDDRQETLKLIQQISSAYTARVQVHYFLPLAGTPLAQETPAKLDYRCIDQLRRLQKNGVCTGWWETGRKMSGELVDLRETLARRKIEFEEIDLAMGEVRSKSGPQDN